MKKIVFILILVSQIFAFEGAMIKTLSKVFSKEAVETVASKYGNNGLNALKKLSAKYGSRGMEKLEIINAKYGRDGLRLVSKYGDEVVKNRATFNIVEKFGDKGYYLIRRFPQRSAEYYEKFGDNFVIVSNKFGQTRVMNYLDEAKNYGADGKIIKFLDKFGEKANNFLERHWGKLLASGFVLLNADDIIKSTENVSKEVIDKTGETVTDVVSNVGKEVVDKTGQTVTDTVSNVANSQFGTLAGIALILFIIFKYGWDFWIKIRS